jgi:four helix bundle protein
MTLLTRQRLRCFPMASYGRPIRGHKDLEVWQRAMDLVVEAYRATKAFPADERYGLTAQLRRSAVSIPSNIAEGRGRRGLRGFLYHLSVANGSIMEMETQLLIAVNLGYLRDTEVQPVIQRCGEVGRLLAGLTRALRRRAPARDAG